MDFTKISIKCPKCGVFTMANGATMGGRMTTLQERCPDCGFTMLMVPINKEYEYTITASTKEERDGRHLVVRDFEAAFTLSRIEIKGKWVLENPYNGNKHSPWLLIKTHLGLIEIGWRKKVISIDWRDTEIRKVITKDDVTKSETMVHAWSIEKVIEYLKEFKKWEIQNERPS